MRAVNDDGLGGRRPGRSTDRAGSSAGGVSSHGRRSPGGWVFRCALAMPVAALVLAVWWAGYWPCVVLGRSMEPSYYRGDVMLVQRTPASEVRVGDTIVWSVGDGPATAHRVVRVRRRGRALVYLTQGDANAARDPRPVRPDELRGRVVGCVPWVGQAVVWMRSPAGLAVTVALPGLALVNSFLTARREVRDNVFVSAPVGPLPHIVPPVAPMRPAEQLRRRRTERRTRARGLW